MRNTLNRIAVLAVTMLAVFAWSPLVADDDVGPGQKLQHGKPQGKGWTNLINKDLAGWKYEPEYWKIEKGVLEGYTPGTPEHHYASIDRPSTARRNNEDDHREKDRENASAQFDKRGQAQILARHAESNAAKRREVPESDAVIIGLRGLALLLVQKRAAYEAESGHVNFLCAALEAASNLNGLPHETGCLQRVQDLVTRQASVRRVQHEFIGIAHSLNLLNDKWPDVNVLE